MSYDSEVLADAPWGYWKLDEATGTTFADTSGNARPMTLSGSTGTPTLAVAGPGGALANAVSFPKGDYRGMTSVQLGTSNATFEIWFKINANPPTYQSVMLVGMANGWAGGATDKQLYVRDDGTLEWYVSFGGRSLLASTATVSLGQWHHVVASVGPAGAKIRLDGATIAANAATTGSYSGGMNVFVPRTGHTNPSGGGMGEAVTVAALSVYAAQLTDTRTDAHRTAALSSVSPVVTLTGTAPTVTGSFSTTVEVPPATATLTGTAPAVTGAVNVAVAVPGISGDLSGAAPKVTGSFAAEIAGAVTGNLAGTAPAVSGSFGITASGAPVEVATDSVNRLYGLSLQTEWHVEVNGPVSTPTRQPAHDYAVATSLPEPTLVEGRPT